VLDCFGSPIRNGDNKNEWLWTFRETTTSKRAEDDLREINLRFSATYELAPVGIVESSPEGKYINGNEQFCAITGYDKKELFELGIQEVTHPDDFTADIELHRKLTADEIPFYQLEKRYVRKDGSIVWCDLFRSAVRDAEGKTLYTIGAVSDITTRKLAEEALRESEESYRILAATASDAIIRIDKNSTIQFANTASERIFGYTLQEMVGQSLTMLMPEEMRPRHYAGFRRYLQTGERNLNWESIEVPARHKTGRTFPLEISFGEYNSGGKRFFIGIARDITERRKAEGLLRESEERFAKAFNSSPLVLTITSLKTGKLTEVNETFINLTGYSREEAIGRTTDELGLWQPTERDAELAAVTSEGQINNTEYSFQMKDGTQIVGLLSAELLEIGGETCALTVIQDITTRKRAEELIRESEEKFRILANSISQFAWMTDASGYIFWYNERWFDYTGTTLEEMQGWGWQKVHHPDEVGRVTEKFKQHIASGEIWEDTFPLRSKTGEYRWFLSRALPIRDENGKILRWFGTNTDIEDVRRAEEKLKDADRRKDEFLATLAHELRNPLAPIRSGLEIIRRSDYDKATIEQTLETVERQTNQIVHLVDDLLEISRITQGKIKLKKGRIELRTAVEMAVETNRELISLNGQDLIISLPDAPVFIDADLTRIAQIILNLINNSAKYTEPGGKIWLTAETKADEVEIRVRDTGIGIPPQMLSGIFEMFTQIETTGEQARAGLGIGLSVVKSLVEMHGGSITAFSAGEGKGSEFVLILPLAKQQSAISKDSEQTSAKEITQTTENAANNNSGQHRILVVDDNADALEMMKVLLMLENHTVRTALDGETAIEIAPEFQPDVCILDIGLPVMDGYELARRLRETMPDVLLIALTGWGQDDDRIRSSEAGFNHHLVKPVEIEKLQTLLAKMP
ncbi:MAG: PAS domain S-box protein, partial [Acidobacteriota bacterium]|nr:PAS domain S-box protein [Acidobacteriota bacterium]